MGARDRGLAGRPLSGRPLFGAHSFGFGGGGGAPGLAKLPVGTPVAILGDSIFRRQNFATTDTVRTTQENRQNGETVWAHSRFPAFINRVWWDPTANIASRVPTYAESMADETYFSGLNFGLSSDTTTGMLRRMEQVVSSGAKICIVAGGTNVGPSNETSEQTIANLQDIVGYLTANGVRVILMMIRPRGVSDTPTGLQISPSLRDRILEINAAIASQGRSWGAVEVVDTVTPILDTQYAPGSSNYFSPLAGTTIDEVHLSPFGAELESYPLEVALRRHIADGLWWAGATNLVTTNTDFTSMAGGGTVGTSVTGTVAAGWGLLNPTGAAQPVTAVGSLVDGGHQQIAVSSAGGGSANTFQTIRLQRAAAISTGFTTTDWVVALWEFEMLDVDPALVFLQATIGQGSTISARGHGQASAAFNSEPSPIRDKLLSGWIATEPLLVESRTSLMPRLDMSVRLDLAGTATLKVKNGLVVKVPDPSVQYPFVP